MKIINERKAEYIIKRTLSTKNDVNKLNTYIIWKKIMPFFMILTSICSTVLVFVTMNKYKENISSVFGKDNLTFYDRLLVILFGFLIFIVCSIVYVFLHEAMHVFANLKNWKNIYIVINFPNTISVLNNKWNTKLQQLICIGLPFTAFILLSFIFFLSTKNLIIFLWINLFNTAYSSSDIVTFCVIIFAINSNVLPCLKKL